jgi:hypothetical protein
MYWPARQHIRILPRPHLPCNGELQSVVLRRGFDAYKRANLILPKDLKTGQKRPLGFDVLLAELLAHGRDDVGDWIPGAGHGFGFPSEPNRDGQREVFERISTWFLQEKANWERFPEFRRLRAELPDEVRFEGKLLERNFSATPFTI